MLTQEQINEDWTVWSDNYNNYVEEEFATNRPEKWLELIESQAPAERPLRILDAGCGPGFFSVLLSASLFVSSAFELPQPANIVPATANVSNTLINFFFIFLFLLNNSPVCFLVSI